MTKKILSGVDDLVFSSKIAVAAKQQGGHLVSVFGNSEAFRQRASAEKPDLIILDLNSTKTPALEVIRTLKADAGLRAVPIVGFLSHIQTELAREATAAGCDRVMARSQFVNELPELVR